MTKQIKVFSIVVLTVAWLFWELWANFDNDPNTWPLTWVIVHYVPAWITLPAVLLLAVWLPYHFWSNYQRKRRRPYPYGTPRAQEVGMNAHFDALNRAFRTFVQGLLVDVSSTVVLVATAQLGDLRWTKAYWYALVLLLAKTAVATAVAYVGRRIKPPPAAIAAPKDGAQR